MPCRTAVLNPSETLPAYSAVMRYSPIFLNFGTVTSYLPPTNWGKLNIRQQALLQKK